MADHVPGLLCRGVRRRLQEFVKAREFQHEGPLGPSEQATHRWGTGSDGAELVGQVPVVPVKEEPEEESPMGPVSSPTEMPSPTTPSDPGMDPAAEYAGPFDEFYGDHRYVVKDNNDVWLLRQHLRGDTSDEEG